MATGAVERFNGEKGFGFIQPDNHGKDVFVHISRAGLRDLQEGKSLTKSKWRAAKEAAGNVKI